MSALRSATPAHFAWTVSEGRWAPYHHLLLLNRKLVDVAAGRCKRLMVFMPPRHGKSELVSRYFPAWYLGTFADRRMILTSYEADFAAGWGRKVRNLLDEHGQSLFGIKVSSDSSAAHRWDIDAHEGGMATAGVRGPITGKGANVVIIDDPVKNDQEAMSETYRENTWDWYLATLSTRLQNDGAIILVMTRWHEDDLAGRLLRAQDEGSDRWEILCLPALAEQDDAMGRAEGEPLCPELFSQETLARTKTRIGTHWWESLYQQRPSPAMGNKFKRSWFRYFEIQSDQVVLHIPDSEPKRYSLRHCWCFQTCDPAGSTKSSADWFALGTWLVTPDKDLLLRDVLRERLEGPDQPKLFRQAYERWQPQPQFQGVETKNMGLTLFQTLRRTGLPVRELKAETDKVTRALPVAARMESGCVYFLRGAPWLGEYEAELLTFPAGQYDDQVDITSYAGLIIAGRTHTGPGVAPKHPAW